MSFEYRGCSIILGTGETTNDVEQWFKGVVDQMHAEVEERMRNLLIYGTSHPEMYDHALWGGIGDRYGTTHPEMRVNDNVLAGYDIGDTVVISGTEYHNGMSFPSNRRGR